MSRERIVESRAARVGRALLSAGAVAAVLTAGVGLLHTPAGRRLMARAGVGCPAMRATPADVEALRLRGLAGLRGVAQAPARPALGLALDGLRSDDVGRWATARGLDCTRRTRPSELVTCANVPGGAVSTAANDLPLDELTFAFAPDGRLVSVSTLRRQLSDATAARALMQIVRDLRTQLGAPEIAAGLPSASDGSPTGNFGTARVQYRFRDYLATLTAMNLGGRVVLREQYQSAL
jgi:hypothetical protein